MKLFKNGILSKYNVLNLEEENILTCYYKMFEEIKKDIDEIKKIVNKFFNRSEMLKLLNGFKNMKKYQYLYDYYQYLIEMEKCLENKENKKIKIKEDGDLLTRKEIKQILYCDFINNFEDNTNYGKSPTGYNTTYWRNIPLELESSLGKDFFIKINLYYDDDNRPNTLKLRVRTIYDIKNRSGLIKYMEHKISPIIAIPSLKRGRDASGEYTLLNYNIDDITFKELRNLIDNIKKL